MRELRRGFWLIIGLAVGMGLPLLFCDLGR